MGFGGRWIRWIEGCIFTSNMSILINGSTTKDFKVEKGLRQGYPLSPFLFVLVMEVLTTLMRKATTIGYFQGFKINEKEEVSMLQFADDTIIMAEGDTASLWSLKAIMRGFEMMSDLKINFHKSNLYDLNVGDWFLNVASSFLSYKVGSLPFKYLGGKTLMEAFPKLFALAEDDVVTMAAAATHSAACRSWNRRKLFGNRDVPPFLWQELTDFLQQAETVMQEEDSFKWSINPDGCFTVKYCYDRFKAKLFGLLLSPEVVIAINHLWKVKVPSKIIFFAWRLLHKRIATIDQLHKRGILMESRDLTCVLCSLEEETITHLLEGCVVTKNV
ncbi:uncharacterized protein LOC131630410 [Vicia villosa]|uniref:uncharacterized protein LOC131630410 n=1 Tax=Vicia villosa TaxID=3911 RepID=UPI00273B1C62|nr:uncharacterized protein LOC131630410 [Vicia villosa]